MTKLYILVVYVVSIVKFANGIFSNSVEELTSANLNRQYCLILEQSISCMKDHSTKEDGCSTLWMFDICWPPTPYNTTAFVPCPRLQHLEINSTTANDKLDVGLHCNATTKTWNERILSTECYADLFANAPVKHVEMVTQIMSNTTMIGSSEEEYFLLDYDESELEEIRNNLMEERRYTILSHCVTAGYSLSLVSLTISLLLFFMLKRLHCTRIYIHINLMLAFFIRGFMWILRLVAFQDSDEVEANMDNATLFLGRNILGRYNESDSPTLVEWKRQYCQPYQEHNFYAWCRTYYVLHNYAVTASFYWLLVEGLYLALILRAMSPNNSQKRIMKIFLLVGWVLPWFSVIGSVVVKLVDPNENNGCWYEDRNKYYWWIIKIPIVISLLVDFVIFVLVVRVVGSKLKVNQRHHADDKTEDYRWRLTKSTLALIPLLGIHYIITAFFYFFTTESSTLIFASRTFEVMIFSIQGFLVSLIYCFLNSEVQEELKRSWKRWKTEWELEVVSKRRRQTNATATSFMNLYSFSMSRKSSGHNAKKFESVGTNCEHSPKRTRFTSTMLTETTKLPLATSQGQKGTTSASPLLEIKETNLSTADHWRHSIHSNKNFRI